MRTPKDTSVSPNTREASVGRWTDPVWCAMTPEAEKKRIAQVEARRAMAAHGIDDARLEATLVQLAGWVEKWAAEERETTQADDDVWVRAVPVKGEVDQRRSRLALVGAVLFVLGVLCGVVLAALRLR